MSVISHRQSGGNRIHHQSGIPSPRRSSQFHTATHATIPEEGMELFERAVKSQLPYYQDYGHYIVRTCIEQPVTGNEEEIAVRVKPAIAVISGFFPAKSPRAQKFDDGKCVDTLMAVFMDCNPDVIQDDYMEAKLKEKMVSTPIPFSDAIKAAKARNYYKFHPPLPHRATYNFISGIRADGYDAHGFLIDLLERGEEKTGTKAKAKGKSSKSKATKAKANKTTMQIEKKSRQKKHKKQAAKGKKYKKSQKRSSNHFYMTLILHMLVSLYIQFHVLYLPCLYLHIQCLELKFLQ